MISAEVARKTTLYGKVCQKELKEYIVEVERRIRDSCSLSHSNAKFELPMNIHNDEIINYLLCELITNGYDVSKFIGWDVIELRISW